MRILQWLVYIFLHNIATSHLDLLEIHKPQQGKHIISHWEIADLSSSRCLDCRCSANCSAWVCACESTYSLTNPAAAAILSGDAGRGSSGRPESTRRGPWAWSIRVMVPSVLSIRILIGFAACVSGSLTPDLMRRAVQQSTRLRRIGQSLPSAHAELFLGYGPWTR